MFRRIRMICGMSVLLGGASLTPCVFAQTESAPNPLVVSVTSRTSQVALTEKESRLLQLKARIRTVDGFDPAIIKITTVDRFDQVRILALGAGFTTVTLVDENDQSYSVEVLVSGDVKQLEAIIRRAAPGSSVQCIKVKDSVLLLGWVDQPGQATKIVELAEQFHPKVLNYLQVSGVQSIMLRVKMMEVQRAKIRQLGFNFLQLREHSYVGSLPGGVSPFSNANPSANLANPLGAFASPAGITSSINPAAATAVFGLIAADNVFQGFIEALKQEALLTILAEPTLITTNGRPADFLSGGEFPVPIPQGLGTVSVQYKPFGVQLQFVPTLLGNGRLRMQVSPQVSEKDLSNTVVVQGITVPSLTTRRVNTEVEMNFGETLVIAGLISNRVQARAQKVPFLGELPWIGTAFRRVSHDEAETELLVMVTPELSAPVDESCLPPGPGESTVVPTDRELYFNGYLETPRYAPDPVPADMTGPGSAGPSGAYAPPAGGDMRSYEPPPAPAAPSYFDSTKSKSPGGAGAAEPLPSPNAPADAPAADPDAAESGKASQTSALFPYNKGSVIRRLSGSRPVQAPKPSKPAARGSTSGPAAQNSSPRSPRDSTSRPGLIAP